MWRRFYFIFTFWTDTLTPYLSSCWSQKYPTLTQSYLSWRRRLCWGLRLFASLRPDELHVTDVAVVVVVLFLQNSVDHGRQLRLWKSWRGRVVWVFLICNTSKDFFLTQVVYQKIHDRQSGSFLCRANTPFNNLTNYVMIHEKHLQPILRGISIFAVVTPAVHLKNQFNFLIFDWKWTFTPIKIIKTINEYNILKCSKTYSRKIILQNESNFSVCLFFFKESPQG